MVVELKLALESGLSDLLVNNNQSLSWESLSCIQLILIFNGSMNCWFHQNQCFHRVESILFPRWGLTGDFKNWSWKTFFCNLRKRFQSFWGRLILFLDAHQILVFHWGTCQVVFEIFSVWCYWIRREGGRCS